MPNSEVPSLIMVFNYRFLVRLFLVPTKYNYFAAFSNSAICEYVGRLAI